MKAQEILDEVAKLDAQELKKFWAEVSRHRAAMSPCDLPLTPGIERESEVCGGSARIVRTRIPVWLLVEMRQLGTSDAEILRNYPALRAEDLENAWSYFTRHPQEFEQEIRENAEY